MVRLNTIVGFLNKYLKIDEINDDSWNGLQVEGRPDVAKIAFAENCNLDVLKKASQNDILSAASREDYFSWVDVSTRENKADLIIVHHGHFWKRNNPSIREWGKERIEFLLKNGISLYAAHLPLDCHKEVGNNAQLIKILGAEIKEEFGKFDDQNVSWIGEFENPVEAKEIISRLNKNLNAKCTPLLFGPQRIKTIAVCSGGGGYGLYHEALTRGVDLYLTGDAIDIYTSAKDAKFNVIFAGHYATETVGVKALMEKVKEKFRVEAVFIDDPTGL